MGAHRLFRRGFIAGDDGLGDLAMLPQDHARPCRAFQRQAADTVELRLHAFDQAPDGWMAGQPREFGMELVVMLEEAGAVADFEIAFLLHDMLFERGLAGIIDMLGRQHDGAAFERLAYELAVMHGGKVDRRDESADLRHHHQETFLDQPLEGLAHRRAADAESHRHARLRHRLSRPQNRSEDVGPQQAVDLFGALSCCCDAHCQALVD
jgi:hypothetical protein